jgi:Putative adhesin
VSRGPPDREDAVQNPDELYYIATSKSMGKRELLLIVAFAVAGLVVYQATAPARPAGSRQVTVGGVIEHMRRAVRGNRASAEVTTAQTQAIDASVTDLRLRLRSATVVIEGEDRSDVAVEMLAWSNGYDDAEAQALAKQTLLKLDPAGTTLIATIEFPEPGSQRATVKMKVPSRLRIRLDGSGPATISNVNAVEMTSGRGTTAISGVAGTVSGVHRGGELTLQRIGSLKLTTQNSDVKLTTAKDVSLTMRGGELRGEGVTGAIEIEANQGDIRLEKIDAAASPLRVNANGGSVEILGLRTEARIDGRNTSVEVVMDRPAPVAIYNEGDEDIEFTPPQAGGYKLDALVRDGRLTPPEILAKLGLTPAASDDNKEMRAIGVVAGGGPTITLRATRGDIVFRERAEERK